MENILYRYNPWWEKGFETSSINFLKRNLLEKIVSENLDNDRIILITGLRRIGKTSLLKLIIRHLIENQISPPTHILYVSLDDYLLIENSIIEIIEEFRKINNLRFAEKIYIFLDEVTYKEDFRIQLKNIYDHHSAKVFASSSSASLLKSQKSFLTGRHLTYELLPLDFNEYLTFKSISYSKADAQLVDKTFHEYLTKGGIPEFVLHDKFEYLQNLVDDIISKDIAAGLKISNIRLLKDFFLLLMERAAKQTSINKIAKILKISPDTSRRYLELFSDTFLINEVPRYGKTNERILAPKKIYVADLGIRSLFTGNRDFGSLFENYTFLKIKHLKPEYLYRDGVEIDFFVGGNLIECKYHQEELTGKQEKLFHSFSASNKFVFRRNSDIESFLRNEY
jgi:uncharacterized protein